MSQSVTLRPYQTSAISKVRTCMAQGQRRVLLVAPTGSGKTIMFSSVIASAVQRGNRALVLIHRKELADQTHDKLSRFGVQASVLMGQDKRRDDLLPIQIGSVQTLIKRMDRLPQARFVIIDEAHHCASETYRTILAAYPEAYVLGTTATPWRTDKLGLAEQYDTHVLAATPSDLMAIGALVEYDAFAYDAPDLHDVKITAGDFNQKDLGVACNTKVLVGNVVREYLEHADGRRAIVFPVNVEHSIRLRDEFRLGGVRADHVDAQTPKAERERVLRGLESGAVTVVTSVGILTEGFDCPAAEVCILVRPTKSLTLHLQMLGRVLRPSPETGKRRALIHDHAGNLLRLGMVEDERDYSPGMTPERVAAIHTCPACNQLFSSTRKGRCPKCGDLIEVYEPREASGGRGDHLTVDGRRISREEIEKLRGRRADLHLERQLTDEQLARAARATRDQKVSEFLRLQEIAARKNFQKGFAAHQFRSVFAHWPKFTEQELAAGRPASTPFFPLPPRKSVA